jgi:hypothetical protein
MYVVRPQPEPEEREALELALGRLLGADSGPAAYRSEWRRAALEEGVGMDEEFDPER